jgi:hypothetical protein
MRDKNQGGIFLTVGDTPFTIDEKTRSVPPHGKECPPAAERSLLSRNGTAVRNYRDHEK